MSAIIGSLFSAQGHTLTDARDFFGVSFLSVMFLSMGAMPELAITLSMKGSVAPPLSPANQTDLPRCDAVLSPEDIAQHILDDA